MDSFRLRTRPLLIATTAMLVLASGTRGTIVAAAGNTVEVSQEQAVTVVGVFPSLRSVVAEVCRRGGVELRAFDARDREVTVSYHGVPLTTALEGLLREESYLVGVAGNEPGKPPRVAWLRVVGGSDAGTTEVIPPGDAGPDSSRPQPTMGFEVPATFGNAEFSSEDPEQRARALHSIASRLVTTKEVMSADPRALAVALRDYPHARQLVTQLRDEQEDPDVRARLDQVLAALP